MCPFEARETGKKSNFFFYCPEKKIVYGKWYQIGRALVADLSLSLSMLVYGYVDEVR